MRKDSLLDTPEEHPETHDSETHDSVRGRTAERSAARSEDSGPSSLRPRRITAWG